MTLKKYKIRGGSGTATTTQMKPPVTKGSNWNPFTIVTKSSAPSTAAVPNQPPSKAKSIITLMKRNLTQMTRKINLKIKSQQMAEKW